MKKPTIEQLLSEVEALKKRIAELEARSAVVIHNHPPAIQPWQTVPHTGHVWPPFPGWRPGDVWCGTAGG